MDLCSPGWVLSNACSEVLVHRQGQSCCMHPCRLGRQLVSVSASVSLLLSVLLKAALFIPPAAPGQVLRQRAVTLMCLLKKSGFTRLLCMFLCLHPAGMSTGRAVAAGTIPSPCTSQQHKQSSSCPSTEGDVSSSPPLAWTQPSAAASPGAESSLSRYRYGAKSSANLLSSI